MTAASLRALILDFDGVIIESNDLKTLTFGEVFAAFPDHAAAMMAFHQAHVSVSRYEKFRHLARLLGCSGDERLVEELAADFSRRMLERAASCPWVPGAEEFLQRWSQRVPLYLVSMTPQEELAAILERRAIVRLFDGVYGCPPWSKSRAVANVVALVGGRDGVILVGDSAGDQRVAAEHALEFIARDSGLPFEAAVSAHADLATIGAMLDARVAVTLPNL